MISAKIIRFCFEGVVFRNKTFKPTMSKRPSLAPKFMSCIGRVINKISSKIKKIY